MNQESRKAGKELRDRETTDRIIAAAIRVHRELGPGFLESVYEQALAVEFALSGIQFVRQKTIPLFYKDHQLGEHCLDFLVEDQIIVELKAISALEEHSLCDWSELFEGNASTRRPAPEFCHRAAHYKALLSRTLQFRS
jgi:GxxExxY protein